jgi:hypothetical protein
MITIQFIIDEEDSSTEIQYDDPSEISDEIAYKILYCSQISKECFLDSADAIADIIGLEKTQAMVNGILERSSTLTGSSQNKKDTVIPTVFLKNDDNGRDAQID